MHDGDIRVWLIDLQRCGPSLWQEELETPRLSADEIERARAHADQQAAQRWLNARVALRLLLESVAGREVRQRSFDKGHAGKLFLGGLPNPVTFSVSHSGHYSLVAISATPVGVDLEFGRRTRFPPSQRALLISAAQALAGEGQTPAAEPDGEVDAALLQAWVRLEAVAKARGSGLGTLLNDIGMRGPASAPSTSAMADRAARLMLQEDLRLEDLGLPAGLWGATAASPSSCNVLLYEFPVNPEEISTCSPLNGSLVAG